MKNRKTVLSLAVAGSLILCSCSNEDTSSEETEVTTSVSETETAVTDENGNYGTGIKISKPVPEIVMKTQIHTGTYNLDIPEFVMENPNKAIDSINLGLDNFETAYDILYKKQQSSASGQGIDCITYPFTNDKYVTAIIRWKETPNDKTDGSIYSYVYDIESERQYTVKRAMSEYNITEEDITNKFSQWYSSTENQIVSVSADAFRITSADIAEFYINALFSDGTSRLYIYNSQSDNFVKYNDSDMNAISMFEQNTSLTTYNADVNKKYTMGGTEYNEAELVAIANREYMTAFSLVSYLFWGKGEYGDKYVEANGKKYYESTRTGLETYENAMEALGNIFLMPENYFSDEISTFLYKDETGKLWINTDRKSGNCVSTGISGVDSVMDSLVVFNTYSEIEGRTAISDYFTIIFSNGEYICTYFTYPM